MKHFKMLLMVLLCYTLLASSHSYAQENGCNATLHGKITDQSNHELEGATVYVMELGKGAIVESDGHFEINNLCSGTYTIKVQHLGHQTTEVKKDITGYTEIVVKLHQEERVLSQVTVVTERHTEQTHAVSELSGKALDETRGLSLGESLRNIAGVNTLQTGPSIAKPIIHGLHSNRIVVMNNGLRHEGQQWGQEHAPEIDPFVANKLTVVKGAAGVRYGADAIGGVVLVEPKDLPAEAGIGGEVNTVFLSNSRQGAASAMLEGYSARLKGLAWRVQSSGKRAGNFKAPDYYLNNTGLSELNFSASLGLKKENYGAELYYSTFSSKIGILSDAHVSDTGDVVHAAQQERPASANNTVFSYKINRPFQDFNHQLLKAKAYFNTGSLGTLNLIYGLQYNFRDEYDLHGPRRSAERALNRPDIYYVLSTHSAEAVWEHKPVSGFSGSVGISNIFQNNIFSSRSGSPLVPDYKNYTGGIFALEKWTSGDWEIEGGIRYDYRWMRSFASRRIAAATFEFQNLTLSGGGIYHINDHWNVKLNASTAWRPPSPNELFSDGYHHGTYSIERGDLDLQPERAFNIIGTIERFGDSFNAELNLYNNLINNYIYLAPGDPELTIRGWLPVFNYRQIDALLQGADFMGSLKLGAEFSLSSKASLLWARNRKTGSYIEMMPANRWENQLMWAPRFAGIKFLNNSYLRLGQVFVDKQRRLPADSRDFAPPPPAYMLFNLEAGGDLPIQDQQISLSAGVNNLFNTAYRDYLNRLRYFADEPGRNIYIRLKFSF
jgi:iron complex outermembrane receptor protein